MKKGLARQFMGIVLAATILIQSVLPVGATDTEDIAARELPVMSEEIESSFESSTSDELESGLETGVCEAKEEGLETYLEESADSSEENFDEHFEDGQSQVQMSEDDWNTENSETLTLDANGGCFFDDEAFNRIGYDNYFGYIGILPGNEGYAFTGWYYEPECINLVSLTSGSGVQSVPADLKGVTIYAGWTDEYYTVTFDATKEGEILEYLEDSSGLQIRKVLVPKDAKWSISGYMSTPWHVSSYIRYVGEGSKKFKNWLDENGKPEINIFSFKPTKDTTFTAQYEAAYKVIYKAGDGTFPRSYSGFEGGYFNEDRDEATIMVKEDASLNSRIIFSTGEYYMMYIPPDPECNDPDKTFIGWYSEDGQKLEGDYLKYYRIYEDTVFEARYASNVKVIFDAGEGSFDGNSQIVYSLLPGETLNERGYTMPEDPTSDDGQFFAGWYRDEDLKDPVIAWDILNQPVEHDTTYYAKYTDAVYVTFNYYDLEDEEEFEISYDIVIAYGDTIGNKAPKVKDRLDGSSFIGWYSDEDCSGEPIDLNKPVEEDLVLYAGYQSDAYYLLTFKTGKDGVTFENGKSEVVVKIKKGQPLIYNSQVNASPVIAYNDAAKATGQVPTGYWSCGSEKYFFSETEYLNSIPPQIVLPNGEIDLLPYTGFIPTRDMEFTAEWKNKIVITYIAPKGCTINTIFPVMRDGKIVYATNDPYFKLAPDGSRTSLTYTTYAGRRLQDFLFNTPQISGGPYSWGANSSGKLIDTTAVLSANTTIYAYKRSDSGESGFDVIAKVKLHAAGGQIYDMSGSKQGEEYALNIRSWSDVMEYAGIKAVSNDTSKVFAGWYLDEECTKKYEHIRYQNGYEIISFPNKISDLYAKFVDAYMVSFDANGGYFDADEKTYSGSNTGVYVERTKAAPGKELNITSFTKRVRNTNNRVFNGWYLDKACTRKAKIELLEYAGEYYTPETSVTLYAKWVRNPEELPVVSVTPATLNLDIGGTGKLAVSVDGKATGDYRFYIASYEYGKNNTGYVLPAIVDCEGYVRAQAEGTLSVYAEVNGAKAKNVVIKVSSKLDTSVGKITYNLDGGVNNEANPAYYTKPNSVELLEPTRNGYDFKGWFIDAKFTQPIDVNTFATVKDVTVYAKWEAKRCTVFFDANGGNFDGALEVAVEVAFNSVYPSDEPASAPTRTGYSFTGWATEVKGGTVVNPGSTKVTPENYDSVRVYAQWTPITYTIRFHSNPPSGKDTTTVQKFTYDEIAPLLANSFKVTGASFANWNTQQDGHGVTYADKQKIVNLGTKDNQVVELYAQWKTVDYVVFLDTGADLSAGVQSGNLEIGGKSFGDISVEELAEAGIDMSKVEGKAGYLLTLKYGEAFELSGKEFVRKGWTLTGWKNSKTGKVLGNTEIKDLTSSCEIIVLTAQWKEDTYKVSYALNGGTYKAGAAKGVTTYKAANGKIALPDAGYLQKTGYTFEGWYDNKEFTGNSYEYVGMSEEGDVLKTLNLFAKWKKTVYTVALKANGGIILNPMAEAAVPIEYDVSVKLPKDYYSRNGYAFECWNTVENPSKQNPGKKIANGAAIKNLSATGEAVVLYAQWKPVTYKITYNLDGGKQAKAISSYTAGSRNELQIPVKAGHTFMGWETDNEHVHIISDEAGKYYIDNVNVSYGNVTLKALWKANTYKVKLHYNRAGYSEEDYVLTDAFESTRGISVNDIVDELTQNTTWKDTRKIKSFSTMPNGKGNNYPVGSTFSRIAGDDGEVLDIYAQWADSYNFAISYNLNGGTLNKPVNTYDRTRDVVIPEPVKKGYVFKGWKIGYNETPGYVYSEYDKPLVAWKKTDEAMDGGAVIVKKLQLSRACNVDIVLTAVYTEAVYTVTIDPNANDAKLFNDFTDADGKTYAADSVFKKTSIGKYGYDSKNQLPEFKRKGYVFKGLYTNKNGVGESVTVTGKATTASSVVLYAVWAPLEYSVEYTANENGLGLSGNTNVSTTKYGKSVSLKNLTETGYTFLGWELKEQYTENGVEYNNPSDISVKVNKNGYVTAINATNNGNLALEAKWRENTITVVLVPNGGKPIDKNLPANFRATEKYSKDLSGILNDFEVYYRAGKYTKKGYVFAGIAADAKGKTMVMDKYGFLLGNYAVAGASRLSAKDGATVTLYAYWEKVSAAQPVVTNAELVGDRIAVDFDVPPTAADTCYEVQVSTSITFTKAVTTTSIVYYGAGEDDFTFDMDTGAVSMNIAPQKDNETNYIRIRQIKTDSEGNSVTGKWSRRVTIK